MLTIEPLPAFKRSAAPALSRFARAIGLACVLLVCGGLVAPLEQSQQAGTRPPTNSRPTPVRTLNSPIVKALLDGVDEIGSPGTPGSLAVWGDDAVPVVTGRVANARAAIVAAGTLGEGRFVAFAHTGYVDPAELDKGDTRRLIGNSIRWAAKAGPAGNPRVGLVGLKDDGFDVGYPIATVRMTSTDWIKRSEEVDVLVFGGGFDLSMDDAVRLGDIVRRGEGVLIAQTGWGWQQSHGGLPMFMHGFSRVLQDAGVCWTSLLTEDDKQDRYIARNAPAELLHAGRAFDALVEQEAGKRTMDKAQIEQAVSTVTEAAKLLPSGDETLRPRLERLLVEMKDKLVPSEKNPITTKEPLRRILLAFDLMSMMQSPSRASHAHPAAAVFPGTVPEGTPRVDREFEIDPRVLGWHSLGLYAVPGEPVDFEFVSGESPTRGENILKLRFGCHRDELWSKEEWMRLPDLAFSFNMNVPSGRHVTPFGGLLYVDVPPNSGIKGPFKVRISGAVEAPLFVLGKTSPAEWREHIRGAPGPWAELATSKVILTVPSSEVRDLDDPEPVLKVWDEVLDAAADLACRPHERERPERYVADVQISVGYMHSGYPIMTHLEAAKAMVSVDDMKRGQWGLFHELGHNHQDSTWTFNGTNEVTCNLFALYILETVCGRPVSSGHVAFKDRGRRIAAHMARPEGPTRSDAWKKDPFLALFMYCQLREEFGWETFMKVFAEYRDLPADQRPKEDADKRDEWLVRFSRAAGKNLGPFFDQWGVQTSHAARDSIKDLPEWMPPGFPPK
jgi:hypothetical protein